MQVNRFFQSSSPTRTIPNPHRSDPCGGFLTPDSPIAGTRTLLVGPPGCARTALLLNYALTGDVASPAYLLTSRSKAESTIAALLDSPNPSKDLQRLQLVYPSGDADLKQFASNLHQIHQTPPRVIAIDDLSSLITPQSHAFSDILASLKEAADWSTVARRRLSLPPCDLIAVDGMSAVAQSSDSTPASSSDRPRHHALYRRWLPLVLVSRACPHAVAPDGSPFVPPGARFALHYDSQIVAQYAVDAGGGVAWSYVIEG